MDPILFIPIIFFGIMFTVMGIGYIKKLRNPALIHKANLMKLVKKIGDAPAFCEVMAQKGRMRVAAAPRDERIEVVRRVSLSTAGYPHRCDYCGNPLYINERECSGCGAPRK